MGTTKIQQGLILLWLNSGADKLENWMIFLGSSSCNLWFFELMSFLGLKPIPLGAFFF